jgi:group I intron endonuclease
MGYIYIITSSSGKSYIGQTTRAIKERFQKHQLKSSKCVAIYNAIKFYGWENFVIDWYECSDDELNKHEKWMIKLMRTLSPEGYNLMEGGGSGGKRSEETKQRMGDGRRGKKNHMWGKHHSEETKKKQSNALRGTKSYMFGNPLSEEIKQKMSEAKLGEKNYKSKRVYQYALDGTFIDSFGSVQEANRHLKKSGSSIEKCVLYKRKTAYNFKWSYTMDIFI